MVRSQIVNEAGSTTNYGKSELEDNGNIYGQFTVDISVLFINLLARVEIAKNVNLIENKKFVVGENGPGCEKNNSQDVEAIAF